MEVDLFGYLKESVNLIIYFYHGCPTGNNIYSYAMIAIGSICSIASLAFTLAMHCMMRCVYSNANTCVAQNQNDINMNPMNMTQLWNYFLIIFQNSMYLSRVSQHVTWNN